MKRFGRITLLGAAIDPGSRGLGVDPVGGPEVAPSKGSEDFLLVITKRPRVSAKRS